MEKLTAEEIKSRVKSIPQWKVKGRELVTNYEFDDFAEALRFVNKVGKLAEKMNHHPDIDIRWNKVKLVLSSHDAGGLTAKDFELAKKIDG